jgi:DNA-binding transcriptional ArsR family regulator
MSTFLSLSNYNTVMSVKTEAGETTDRGRSFVSSEDTREFIQKVVKEYPDESVYILPQEGADEILTQKRMEIIETLREKDIESIRGLSRNLDRDVSAVSRDLEILRENDIIEYSEERGRKRPQLTTEKIVVEPL